MLKPTGYIMLLLSSWDVGSARPHTTPEHPEWTEAAVGGRKPGAAGRRHSGPLCQPPHAGVPPRNTVEGHIVVQWTIGGDITAL